MSICVTSAVIEHLEHSAHGVDVGTSASEFIGYSIRADNKYPQ